jgi:hypothetical protein
MHLTHVQTILQPADGIQKVSSLAWAPNKCVHCSGNSTVLVILDYRLL